MYEEEDIPSSMNSFGRQRLVTISRPVYTEKDFVSLCKDQDEPKEPLITRTMTKVKGKVSDYSCACIGKRLQSFFPFFTWIRKYKKPFISRDISAGLTLGIFQIPQGMAYGMLTTLPAIYGLYTSLVPVLVYFFMGSSRFLSIGTFAIISLMVGEAIENQIHLTNIPSISSNVTVAEVEEFEIKTRIQIAVTLSFLVGIIQFVFGILRFGFITIFLSDALISGFTTGAAFHIATSQVKHLVGINIPRERTGGIFSIFKTFIYIFENIKHVNYTSFIIGVVAFIILFAIKHFTQKYKDKIKIPIPAELIVIVLGLGLSYGLKFHMKYKVKILKNVPKGLPPLTLPSFEIMDDLLISSITIALVSYAISVSVAKSFAKKHNDDLDTDQELYAYGLSNVVSSFFSCFVSSASLSRSLIQENLGSTQISSIYSIAVVLLTLTLLAPLFNDLPNAILASIIMVALKGLFRQFSVVKVLYKISKVDSLIWTSSFIAVVCLGVDYGLAVGFILNLLATVVRASRPSSTLMGNMENTEIYTSVGYEPAKEIPGVKIFRFHAPLFYANTEYFQKALFKSTVSPFNCVKLSIPKSFRTHSVSSTNKEMMTNGYCSSHEEEIIDTISLDEDQSGDKQTKVNISSVDISSICPIHTIIIDCSQVSYTDTMGVGCLISVFIEYQKFDVDVLLSHCAGALLVTLQNGGFTSHCGMDNIFMTTHDAVNFAYHKPHLEGILDVDDVKKKKLNKWEMVTMDTSNGDVRDDVPDNIMIVGPYQTDDQQGAIIT